jgi:putative thioredoxin
MIFETQEKNNPYNANEDSAGDTYAVIKDVTALSFAQDVLVASQKHCVLVHIWSPRSQSCVQLMPILEKYVRKLQTHKPGLVSLKKLNSDQFPHILAQLGLRSVPAVLAFRNGMPVDGFMGSLSDNDVKDFLERLLGVSWDLDSIQEQMREAEHLTHVGDFGGAAQIYGHILAENPSHFGALLALIKIYMHLKDYSLARSFLNMVPEDAFIQDAGLLAAKKALELVEQTESLKGSTEELEERLRAYPEDWEACFDLALLYNGASRRMEALDLLLAVVRYDRQWREDGARKQLLEFFDIWGSEAPETQVGRRKLAALLFS